jgi:hypothetical protein
MSLTDLKKSNISKKANESFTVDDFIADAEDYARGDPKVVSKGQLNLSQAIAEANKSKKIKPKPSVSIKKKKNPKKIMYIKSLQDQHTNKRHATFTLSEEVIEQLDLLAKKTNLAKSHIIRILIGELSNEEQKKKLEKLLKSEIN